LMVLLGDCLGDDSTQLGSCGAFCTVCGGIDGPVRARSAPEDSAWRRTAWHQHGANRDDPQR
jgi:hypothetical protein